MPLVLDGRVFARQQLFMTLPKSLQDDAKHFRAYVEQDTTRLFQNNRPALVYGVTGKDLVGVLVSWLHAHHVPAAKTNPVSGLETTVQDSNGSSVVSKKQLETAKQVAEALVLLGFLTPYKEDDVQLTVITANHYVHENELLIPVAPSVTDLATTSVWSVADGAIYACALKRKAGLLSPFTKGRDVYVVFNDKTKKAYLFESDLARELISELSGPTLNVEIDSSHFEFGVRVSLATGYDANTPETFNAMDMAVQQELVHAFISIGAKCKEEQPSGPDDQPFERNIRTHQDQPTAERSYHDQSFAAPQGTPAYALELTKHNGHLSDEPHVAPHVAP